jgi:hypothetical protein
VPTTTDTFTCLTCTGCDPNGCLGQTCTRTCDGTYDWVEFFNDCPIDAPGCTCPPTVGPCDAAHAGNIEQYPCAGTGCVNLCRHQCNATGGVWVETTPCPSGCLCTDTLATCDVAHIGDTVTTACAEPTWA